MLQWCLYYRNMSAGINGTTHIRRTLLMWSYMVAEVAAWMTLVGNRIQLMLIIALENSGMVGDSYIKFCWGTVNVLFTLVLIPSCTSCKDLTFIRSGTAFKVAFMICCWRKCSIPPIILVCWYTINSWSWDFGKEQIQTAHIYQQYNDWRNAKRWNTVTQECMWGCLYHTVR